MNTKSKHGVRAPVVNRQYQISKLRVSSKQLTVEWADGHTSRYNRFWLRDNCSTAGDKLTAIRNFRLRQMDQETSIESAEITDNGDIKVIWKQEKHTSTYTPTWLREHCCEPASAKRRTHRPVLWGDEINQAIPSVSFSNLAVDSEQNLTLLKHIVDYGIVRINDLPATPEGIEQLEPLLAPFTENDFGRIFDLISEPEVWDLSQSSEALDPHTDDPYRYAPPGIRILYCVQASDEGGGASEIVNGIAAGEHMRQQDPDGFKLLCDTPIPYVRYREDPVPQGSDVHLRCEAPIIRLNLAGDVVGVRFHERSMATFDLAPDIVDRYYLALISFSEIINSGKFALKHLLQPGEAFVFDNQQVLHGRTEFTGMASRRHLRLSQMARDLVHSRYRLLLSRHNQTGATDVLASGV